MSKYKKKSKKREKESFRNNKKNDTTSKMLQVLKLFTKIGHIILEMFQFFNS